MMSAKKELLHVPLVLVENVEPAWSGSLVIVGAVLSPLGRPLAPYKIILPSLVFVADQVVKVTGESASRLVLLFELCS